MFEVFRSRKMLVLMLLGFSSGIPLYLTSRTLQAWMTTDGVDLSTIGFLSLIGLPYSLKFVWAPLLDRYSFPGLGRRRGWLLLSQAALALSIGAMFFARPGSHIRPFATVAFLIAFLSATQDITVNAYPADILQPNEVGAGVGISVLGYRIALILTGSVALMLAGYWSWPAVYLAMSLLMLATLLASTIAPEPVLTERPPATMREAVRMPIMEFFRRRGTVNASLILLFIILYRLGDSMINNMTTPFLLQTGFTLSDVGAIQTGVGLLATIVGVLAGGAVLSRVGINRSLWIFGGFQAVSNLAYWMLAESGRNYSLMVGTIIVENVCTGLGTAALVGFLISLCNPRFSATQYALLSSVMAVGRDVLVAPTGRLAELTGWPLFFLISFAAALPGLMLLPAFAPWQGPRSAAPLTALSGNKRN